MTFSFANLFKPPRAPVVEEPRVTMFRFGEDSYRNARCKLKIVECDGFNVKLQIMDHPKLEGNFIYSNFDRMMWKKTNRDIRTAIAIGSWIEVVFENHPIKSFPNLVPRITRARKPHYKTVRNDR